MKQQDGFWKRFESTGQIEDYLHYKQGPDADSEESKHADDHQGIGPAGDKDE